MQKETPYSTLMIEVKINNQDLQQAAEKGDDAFVGVFVENIRKAIGGDLTAENMGELNPDQITLLGWDVLHTEVMDGGLIQLIHNGYGGFIYMNPTDKAFRNWGMIDLYRWINRSHGLYVSNHQVIEKDCSDDEFMALYEKFPQFDDFDDAFVENEEQWTSDIAHYIDEHIVPGEGDIVGKSTFALIVND